MATTIYTVYTYITEELLEGNEWKHNLFPNFKETVQSVEFLHPFIAQSTIF